LLVIQEQKQLISKNNVQAQEIRSLKERTNSLLLREERRKKAQEKINIDMPSPIQQPTVPVVETDCKLETNIVKPHDDKRKSMEFTNDDTEGELENARLPLEEDMENQNLQLENRKDAVVEVVNDVPEAKRRRVSQFVSRAITAPVSMSEEKPAECKQQ